MANTEVKNGKRETAMKINSCSGLEQPAPAFVFNIPLFAGILLVIVFILVIIGAYNEWEKYKK